MPTVRTTFQPDKPIEVDDVEYAQLKAQKLLVDDPAPEVPAAPVLPATVKKTSGAAGSKES